MSNIKQITLPDGSTYDVGNSLCLGINNQTWNAQETQFTGTLNYTKTEIHDLVTNGTFVWFQYYDSLADDIIMLFPYGDNFWMDLGYSRRGFLTNSGITVNVAPGFAALSSPSFTGTPTAPTPTPLDNSTKIATTAWVNSKINLAIPEIEEAAMKVKIYYVIPDDSSGQGGYWSGQDYMSYTLGSCGIYVDSEGTTLISSTPQLITDISNGIIPVLNVIDQDGHYVLCYPNWIEDDTLVADFIGIVNSTNKEFIALKINVDIDNSKKRIYNGYYLINSGLPAVTSSDNGKFLRVVNGAWAAASVPNANGVSF